VLIMLGCGIVLVAVLVPGIRWSALPFRTNPPLAEPTPVEVGRRYTWYCSILLLGGLVAGIGTIGVGGRLAMRLLAVTSDDTAQGAITEADEIVGDITLGGTIGFVLFNGIIGGVLATAIYLIVRRFLPTGPWGGIGFGLALLAVFGATIDPLRRENPDFDIVGPGWLSVLTFTALAIAFGVAVQGWTARLSTWLPLPATDRRVAVRYLPVAAAAVVGYLLTIVFAVVGIVVVAVTRLWRPVACLVRSDAWVRGGRILLGAVVLVCLPILLVSVVDIISR